MWENPLSLRIKETVCIMYTGGEGGTQKKEEGVIGGHLVGGHRRVEKFFFWRLISVSFGLKC